MRAGDEAAFHALIDAHRPSIRAAFLAMGASPEDADDLTQDVFLRAMRNIASLRDEAKLGSWLFGIVRNLRLQYFREQVRRATSSVDDQLPAGDPSPLTRTLDAERRLAVQGVLTQLDEPAQELIRLRYAGGLSYKEIASRLGLTVDNVGVRLHRISNRLRATLTSWGPSS